MAKSTIMEAKVSKSIIFYLYPGWFTVLGVQEEAWKKLALYGDYGFKTEEASQPIPF